jgi:hypothetical protein
VCMYLQYRVTACSYADDELPGALSMLMLAPQLKCLSCGSFLRFFNLAIIALVASTRD